MPVTSKEVQTVFCRLFCITKKLYINTHTQKRHPPTSVFIDKALKITKPQLKNSTEIQCVVSSGCNLSKNGKQGNIEDHVEM